MPLLLYFSLCNFKFIIVYIFCALYPCEYTARGPLLTACSPTMVYPGWEVGIITPSVNNSETVKAVTLAFCSIQQHFIRDICAKFGVPNWPQSPDIGQNSGGCISNFWISGQSLINKFCQEKIVKIDKRNTATMTNMSPNCDMIVFFPIYGQFAAIWKP